MKLLLRSRASPHCEEAKGNLQILQKSLIFLQDADLSQ